MTTRLRAAIVVLADTETHEGMGRVANALEAVKELRRYDPQKADKLFNLIMKP